MGRALLFGLPAWELATGDGVDPRYPLALIALAVPAPARGLAARTGSRRLGVLAAGRVGAAGGLMVGGFL